MKKIKQFFLFLILSQKEFLKPKRKKILIFDGTNYKLLVKSLRTKEISILFIRGEIINFYILSKVFFNKIYLIFNPTLFWKEYLFNYIETVNPKIILTYIDNNPFFYTLKKNLHLKLLFLFKMVTDLKKEIYLENLLIKNGNNYIVITSFVSTRMLLKCMKNS